MLRTRVGWFVLVLGPAWLGLVCVSGAAPPPAGPAAGAVIIGPLSTPATAMSLGAVEEGSGEAELVSAGPGGIQVWPGHGDRGFTGLRSVALPVVDPVGVAVIRQGAAVADRVANALVFAKEDERGRLVAGGSLPLGTAPAAMAAIEVDLGGEVDTLLAVANQGSGEVSLVNADARSDATRVEVGTAPGSIALADTLDSDVIAAVGTPAGVTVLIAAHAFDGVDGNVQQRLPVAAGATAVALAQSPDTGNTVDGDPFPDLLVARGDGALVLYHGVKGSRFRTRGDVVSAPGSVAAPARLFAGRFGGDRAMDFAAIGADGRVTEFLGSLQRPRLQAMPAIDAGAMPAAATVGDVAGDDLDDLVVSSSDRGELRTVVSGRDRSISSDATAADLASGSGHVVWWRRAGSGYQLVDWAAGRLRDLPVSVSARPLRTIVGRDAAGHPIASFVGCTPRGCGPYRATLPTGAEHAVALHLPPGCRAEGVAVSGSDVAYGTVRGRRCPPSTRGMWLHRAGSRPVRLTKRRGELGDLDADRVAWNDYTSISGRAWVRGTGQAHLVGRVTSPGVEDFIDGSLRGPLFSGADVYWAEWVSFTEGDTGTLYRASPSGARCQGTIRDLPTHRGELDAAAHSGRVYYADHRGVFEAQRSSLEWDHERCLP